MTRPRDDDGLRGRFRALREETEASGGAPEFRLMLERARADAVSGPTFDVVEGGAPRRRAGSGRPLVRAGAWASAALAATVAGLLLTDRRPRNDDEFLRVVAAYSDDFAGAGWQSPTAGLLDVPGLDLVRTLPELGGPVRGLDPATLPPPESLPPENL